MVRADLPDVAGIEQAGCKRPLSLERLAAWLRRKDVPQIGLLATCECEGGDREEIAGFALYAVGDGRVSLARLVVRPAVRRMGVGRQLLGEVCRRVATVHCLPTLTCTVRETDADVLKFLRGCGVPPTKVVRGKFSDTGEDGIHFAVQWPGVEAVAETLRAA